MASSTPKLQLIKPDKSELFSLDVFNGNMDKIEKGAQESFKGVGIILAGSEIVYEAGWEPGSQRLTDQPFTDGYGGLRVMRMEIKRTGGSFAYTAAPTFTQVASSAIPKSAQGGVTQPDIIPGVISGSGVNQDCHVSFNPNTGSVGFRGTTNFTFNKNANIYFNYVWHYIN